MKPLELKIARVMLDMSQTQLADAAGISQGTVAKIENGKFVKWGKYKTSLLAALEVKRKARIEAIDYEKQELLNLF